MSALTYGQVLYLLPISLFGMAVAAAELPELARLGRAGARAIRERLRRRAWSASPSTSRSPSPSTCSPATSSWACSCSAASSRPPTPSSCGTSSPRSRSACSAPRGPASSRTGSTPSIDPKLVARIAVFRVALAAVLGALLMFPFDRFAIVDGSVDAGRLDRFPPAARFAPRRWRAARHGSGSWAWPSGAALSSWVEYRLLRGALQWRIGALPPMGARLALVRSSPPPAAASWPPGSDRSPTTCRALDRRRGGVRPDDARCTSSSPP